jgi:hypothetical protein
LRCSILCRLTTCIKLGRGLRRRIKPRSYRGHCSRLVRYRWPGSRPPIATLGSPIAVILQAVDADDAPLHLPLGPIAHAIAERKLAAFRSNIDAWRDITIATDFDQP